MANDKPISKDYLLTQLKNYETQIINDRYMADNDIEIYSEDDIINLINLSEEEILQLTSLISDDTIETGKTHSSSKIYQDLQKVLT